MATWETNEGGGGGGGGNGGGGAEGDGGEFILKSEVYGIQNGADAKRLCYHL